MEKKTKNMDSLSSLGLKKTFFKCKKKKPKKNTQQFHPKTQAPSTQMLKVIPNLEANKIELGLLK